MKLRFTWGLCLLIVAVATGIAQHQDVRLSPEPFVATLPNSIRIQSAATVGNSTLVVWGTVRANGDSSVVNTLWSQIIHGTESIPGKALTDTIFQPADLVSVHGLRDRFLVMWNEPYKGMYLCIIDTNGKVLIPAKQINNSAAINDNLIWLLYRESGYLLIYKNYYTGHGLAAVALNNDGHIAKESWNVLSEGVQDVIVHSHSPNVAIIRTNAGGRVLYADGTLDERIIPNERLSAMPNIRSDASLYCIIKDTLYKFNDYFDTNPQWKRQVQLLDGIKDTYIITPKSGDSSVSIIYAAHTRIPVNSNSYADEIRQCHINLIENKDTISTLASFIVPWSSQYSYPQNFYVEKSIDQLYRLIVVYNIYHIVGTKKITYPSLNLVATVDSVGLITMPLMASKDSIPSFIRAVSSGTTVTRKSSIDSSVVLLVSKRIQSSAPIDFYHRNISQIEPILTLLNGKIILTYTQESHSTIPLSFELLTKNEILQDSIVFLPQFNFTNTPSIDEYTNRNYWMNRNAGQGILVEYDYVFRPRQPHSGDMQENTIELCRFFLPSDTGWTFISNMIGNYIDKEKRSPYLNYITTSSIVDRQWGLAMSGAMQAFNKDYEMRRIIALITKETTNNSIITNAPNTGIHPANDSLEAVIPIASNSFFAISPSSITKYYDTTAVLYRTIQPHSYSTYCIAANHTFLRYYSPQSDSSSIIIESYDTTLQRRALVTIPAKKRFPQVAFAQNPNDGSIAVLQESDSGIALTLLDRNLYTYKDTLTTKESINIPISSGRSPAFFISGVFRNDTLFFVWEDHRNFVADIYGNTWTKPNSMLHQRINEDRPSDTVRISSNLSYTFFPNPVSNSLIINCFSDRDTTITLQIVNLLGQPIRRWKEYIQQGEYQAVISLQGIATGYYLLFIEDDSNTITFPFIALGYQ